MLEVKKYRRFLEYDLIIFASWPNKKRTLPSATLTRFLMFTKIGEKAENCSWLLIFWKFFKLSTDRMCCS